MSRSASPSPLAFGTNLLGAIVGGSFEYLSLVFGYRALLVLAAALYVGAYLVMPSDPGPADDDSEPAENLQGEADFRSSPRMGSAAR